MKQLRHYQKARCGEYSFGEAFKVYLGGHLIGAMSYTIPEAKQILEDLDDWLTRQGFYSEKGGDKPKHTPDLVKHWDVFIKPRNNFGFSYTVKGILDGPKIKPFKGIKNAQHETYIEDVIVLKDHKTGVQVDGMAKKLCISLLRNIFILKLSM